MVSPASLQCDSAGEEAEVAVLPTPSRDTVTWRHVASIRVSYRQQRGAAVTLTYHSPQCLESPAWDASWVLLLKAQHSTEECSSDSPVLLYKVFFTDNYVYPMIVEYHGSCKLATKISRPNCMWASFKLGGSEIFSLWSFRWVNATTHHNLWPLCGHAVQPTVI